MQLTRAAKEAGEELVNLRKLTKGRLYMNCPHCNKAVVIAEGRGLVAWDEEAARLEREQAADKATEVESVLAERDQRA